MKNCTDTIMSRSTINADERPHNKLAANRPQPQHNQTDRISTKVRINNSDNSRKTLVRDLIIAFIPMFVLFKISTHPYISKIGNRESNGLTRHSQNDLLEKIVLNLSLKKHQEEMQNKRLFFEAMNERECYDTPTIEIPTNNKNQQKGRSKVVKRRSFNRRNKKHKPKQKYTTSRSKIKPGKMNRPMARRPTDRPSATSWGTLVGRAFWGDSPTTASLVNKGAESTTKNGKLLEKQQDGKNKKGGKRKGPRKKKFGSRRFVQK